MERFDLQRRTIGVDPAKLGRLFILGLRSASRFLCRGAKLLRRCEAQAEHEAEAEKELKVEACDAHAYAHSKFEGLIHLSGVSTCVGRFSEGLGGRRKLGRYAHSQRRRTDDSWTVRDSKSTSGGRSKPLRARSEKQGAHHLDFSCASISHPPQTEINGFDRFVSFH